MTSYLNFWVWSYVCWAHRKFIKIKYSTTRINYNTTFLVSFGEFWMKTILKFSSLLSSRWGYNIYISKSCQSLNYIPSNSCWYEWEPIPHPPPPPIKMITWGVWHWTFYFDTCWASAIISAVCIPYTRTVHHSNGQLLTIRFHGAFNTSKWQ